MLEPLGESARGVAEMRRAVEVDPLSLIINETLGEALMRAGRLDEAIVQLRKTIEMDAGFPMPAALWGRRSSSKVRCRKPWPSIRRRSR